MKMSYDNWVAAVNRALLGIRLSYAATATVDILRFSFNFPDAYRKGVTPTTAARRAIARRRVASR